MLISIETHITCDFPGGSGPPIPPSGSAHVINVFVWSLHIHELQVSRHPGVSRSGLKLR